MSDLASRFVPKDFDDLQKTIFGDKPDIASKEVGRSSLRPNPC